MKRKLKPLVIGKDGRSSAIVRSLMASSRCEFPIAESPDPKGGSAKVAKADALALARDAKPDFAIIGPEEPLAAGFVDALQEMGIPCIGPTKSLARLESSKAFTRNLLARHKIPGNPEHKVFRKLEGIEPYLRMLGGYVVKPDGLTGGKGVKVSDAHLFSVEEALQYCKEVFETHHAVVIEEKLDGEEFSLQSFCDGTHVKHMVPVQDHKRLGEGDTGPNTGGMGSYSCADHSLPFLRPEHLRAAHQINEAVARALFKETKEKYKGILYGGFMATRSGVRLIEYNARFGDPETLNVLSVLQTDFIDICEAIIEERLHKLPIHFARKATVCKYIVPEGYPDDPKKDVPIDLSDVPSGDSAQLKRYDASLNYRNGESYLTGSRAIAFVGIGKDLDEAEAIAEKAASSVGGPVFHRKDIGTHELIQHRIAHMKEILSERSHSIIRH